MIIRNDQDLLDWVLNKTNEWYTKEDPEKVILVVNYRWGYDKNKFPIVPPDKVLNKLLDILNGENFEYGSDWSFLDNIDFGSLILSISTEVWRDEALGWLNAQLKDK